MDVRSIDIKKINPAPYNPRKELEPGDAEYEKLRQSIERFGFVEPLVWNERTGHLVGGHQRLKILNAQGATSVEVSVVNLDETEERALNLALNKIEGEWDEDKLRDVLAELESRKFDLSLTGFSDKEIDNLLSDLQQEVDDDREPGAPSEPITKPGDIWTLGPHRLMCGDSTRLDDVNRLLDENKVHLIVSSPPYNVGKEYDAYNDRQARSDYLDFIRALLVSCKAVLERGRLICWNVSHNSSWDVPSFHSVILEELGFRFVDAIVWEKPDGSSARFGQTVQNPYPTYYRPNNIYERVIVAGNEEIELEALFAYEIVFVQSHGEPKKSKQGGRILRRAKQFRGDIWRFSGKGSAEHPAPFPVQLPLNCMEFYSRSGERVFDPCGGSGTTLIAAHKADRQAYLMELSPAYCDVICARYEKLTGEKAVRAHGTQEEVRAAVQAHTGR